MANFFVIFVPLPTVIPHLMRGCTPPGLFLLLIWKNQQLDAVNVLYKMEFLEYNSCMSLKKKQIREDFRKAVFIRDRHRCRVCGREGDLDAHHIISRDDMPNGGYVKENGISLCTSPSPSCHEKAEEWLKNGRGEEGYDPDTLFRLVGSSFDLALKADGKGI
jgi:ribosomal protein S14